MSEIAAFDIDESSIWNTLAATANPSAARVREILAKAREMKGLGADDVATLSVISDPDLIAELFDAARFVKDTIYGKRLVIFAPLYVSNLCANECLYCAFRALNKEVERRALTSEEIARETRVLIDQ
ncbi:MAG: [FeFe] hydrogenase H-cluster radical SAM maturase HydG, partial [Rhodospirillaceae bacterium]